MAMDEMLSSLRIMLERSAARRRTDAIRFKEIRDDSCMMCHAEGPDKRDLIVDCFYDIHEVVPEAIDLSEVDGRLKGHGYILRICKACRASFIGHMEKWRDERIARRGASMDRDGYDDVEMRYGGGEE